MLISGSDLSESIAYRARKRVISIWKREDNGGDV